MLSEAGAPTACSGPNRPAHAGRGPHTARPREGGGAGPKLAPEGSSRYGAFSGVPALRDAICNLPRTLGNTTASRMTVRILTFTLNPSIDVSASVDTLTHEHKLRASGVHRDPGGGGINVARVLRRFGADCRALYPVGGCLGSLLRELLEREGVEGIPIEIAEETRESFTVIERSSGREFRFLLPGPQLSDGDWRACLDHLATLEEPPAYVVASGSLPAGVPDDFYRRLACTARERGSRMVLDTSGPPLAAALEEGVYLVKPNLRELRELTAEPLEQEDEWARAAGELVRASKAEVVALSLGHRGALLAAQGLVLRAPALPVEVASTVGAGDSFLALMVSRLAAGAPLEEAFRYGVAGGTAALLAPGTSLAHPEDTERLARQVELRRL
jgi:6-phosphofructokinase 2